MPRRLKPRIEQDDIDRAMNDILNSVEMEQFSDLDRQLMIGLMKDYANWCAISDAAWRNIESEGLMQQISSGAKGNVHTRLEKSGSLDVYKSAISMKLSLAARISALAKNVVTEIKEDTTDALEEFNRG